MVHRPATCGIQSNSINTYQDVLDGIPKTWDARSLGQASNELKTVTAMHVGTPSTEISACKTVSKPWLESFMPESHTSRTSTHLKFASKFGHEALFGVADIPAPDVRALYCVQYVLCRSSVFFFRYFYSSV